MDKKKLAEQVNNDPDFINLPKYNNSLTTFLGEHPNGTSDSVICKALCITQEELDILLKNVIIKLQESVGENAEE